MRQDPRTVRLSRELIDALDRECAREARRYDRPDCPPGVPAPRADLIRRLLWEALAQRGALNPPKRALTAADCERRAMEAQVYPSLLGEGLGS